MKRIDLCGLVFLGAFALTAWSQQSTPVTSKETVIKKVPITDTSVTSGHEMYMAYCAACHGKEGKGDGPAAPALKLPPPDLTLLAEKNNGKYPAESVAYVLRFGATAPAHGSAEMPIWGHLFRSLHSRSDSGDQQVRMRISNLTDYIKTLQAK